MKEKSTNQQVEKAKEFLEQGDAGKDISIEGKSSQERRENLKEIINAQKRNHQLCKN